jgi:hypothetical protein
MVNLLFGLLSGSINDRFGSLPVIEYIPEAVVRTAALEGKADYAIRRKQSLGDCVAPLAMTGLRSQ